MFIIIDGEEAVNVSRAVRLFIEKDDDCDSCGEKFYVSAEFDDLEDRRISKDFKTESHAKTFLHDFVLMLLNQRTQKQS